MNIFNFNQIQLLTVGELNTGRKVINFKGIEPANMEVNSLSGDLVQQNLNYHQNSSLVRFTVSVLYISRMHLFQY